MIKYKKPFSKFCYVALEVFLALNTGVCIFLQLVSLLDTFDDSL